MEDIFTFMDDDKLDREWIVRNILGGMSAGFGLRGESSHIQTQSNTEMDGHIQLSLTSLLCSQHSSSLLVG